MSAALLDHCAILLVTLAGSAPRGVAVRPPEAPDQSRALLAARDLPQARSTPYAVSVGPWVSVQVNVDEAGLNIVGDAANEPSITVDPLDRDRKAIAWRQFDSIASNFRQAGWAYTTDAGATWTFPGVLEPGIFRSDPVLDTDSSGHFFYQSLTVVGGDYLVDVFESADGGATWGAPVPEFGGDKNWLAIDRSGGPGEGHVYGIWQRYFGCCGTDTFTRSIDGGSSFEVPIEVPSHPTFGTIAVGPDGEVYATGIEAIQGQDYSTFVVAKSLDARLGAGTPTFSGLVVDLGGEMMIGAGPNPAGLLGQAIVAVDRSPGPARANVYVLATVDPSPLLEPEQTDVHLIRSTDGGATWSEPIRVHDDPPGEEVWHWFGTFAVAPNGRIDAIWNDTRNSGQANVSELFYAWSWDEGETWSENRTVSPPFDSHVGWPNQNKIGDYYGIVSDESGADVAYAATFNGEQDVWYLRLFPDCNESGTSDVDDISSRASFDVNGNLVPDECECLADFDGSLDVGFGDLTLLLVEWGPCTLPCLPDLDGSLDVGFADLTLLLLAWGDCP